MQDRTDIESTQAEVVKGIMNDGNGEDESGDHHMVETVNHKVTDVDDSKGIQYMAQPNSRRKWITNYKDIQL